VDNSTAWGSDEWDESDFSPSILMHGSPAGDASTASSALICFHPDGDERLIAPVYDAVTQRIRIFYPLSSFEGLVDIIKNNSEVICSLHACNAMPEKNSAFLHGNNPFPAKLH